MSAGKTEFMPFAMELVWSEHKRSHFNDCVFYVDNHYPLDH